ncbi:glycosyltransferase [Pseudarthrobacter oxydans]|uniref:glycosyltransferase n=1 Tax=Pseudarthrobacter oxydans TaxID=1671 RepID=UPI003D2A58E8
MDRAKGLAALASAAETRRLLDEKLPNCKKLGFYAGRLTEDKGVVRAAEIIADLPSVGLIIAGTGPSEERLRAIAAHSPNILFLGQIENPLLFAAAADFGILLTNDPGEGRPLFALECVSVGTPVIANANSSAVEDLISEVGLGAIIPVQASDAGAIRSAFDTAERFEPVMLDWGKAAAIFTESLASEANPANKSI